MDGNCSAECSLALFLSPPSSLPPPSSSFFLLFILYPQPNWTLSCPHAADAPPQTCFPSAVVPLSGHPTQTWQVFHFSNLPPPPDSHLNLRKPPHLWMSRAEPWSLLWLHAPGIFEQADSIAPCPACCGFCFPAHLNNTSDYHGKP